MANVLVQHNIPFSIAEDLRLLFCNIFTDGQITKAYASGRTKTTCILNNEIAPHFTGKYSVHQLNYCTVHKMYVCFSFTCESNESVY